MDYEKDFSDGYFTHSVGKLHFRHHAGNGKAIVFVHGLGGNARTWRKLCTHLDGNLDLYLIDLLGHGKSDAPDVDYTVKLNTEIVNGMIKSWGLSRCLIFGHSYGGWIAARCAMSNRAVKALVLEDSAGLEEFASDRSDANPEYREEQIRRAIEINPRPHVLKSMVHSDNAAYFLNEANLAELAVPSMIIWGSKDEIVDIRYAKVFKRYIRDSRLEVLHGSGHVPHYTDPEKVAELLGDFMRSL
ncbi:MAG: alpha/beta hydrolase [Candidatus Micrarchaeota archaeon]|nr:alpha/beta hydrolase [Candidatus Micrarchaeota archaeon]